MCSLVNSWHNNCMIYHNRVRVNINIADRRMVAVCIYTCDMSDGGVSFNSHHMQCCQTSLLKNLKLVQVNTGTTCITLIKHAVESLWKISVSWNLVRNWKTKLKLGRISAAGLPTKSHKIYHWHLGISLKLINSDISLLPSFISQVQVCKKIIIFFLGAF